MLGLKLGATVVKSIALTVMLGTTWHAIAQDAKTLYPSMAPVEQYLIEDRSAEIALGTECGAGIHCTRC